MLIKIYDKNPNPNEVGKVVDILQRGGVVIVPTDTVYAFSCSIFSTKAVENISKIKSKDLNKSNLSFICESYSQISEFAKMDDDSFRLIKRCLPGPFTFLLNGNNRLPKLFKNKKEVGIRIPNNSVVLEIVRQLGNPIMVSSIFTDDYTTEYITDPELIEEKYGNQIDAVVDGGMGGLVHSTIIDCTGDFPEIRRFGAGKIDF